ncbi:transglycosylase domain-containing protein [Goodfellowiella coeruleoviolacea]|nr:transglycosylase domain-containing protein [Goodfellowiella coeruleoviolacea]
MPPGSRPPGHPGQPPRVNPAEQSTDFIPPAPEPIQREPALLTHREPDPDDDVVAQQFSDGLPDDADADDVDLSAEEARRLRKKKIWRRIRRTCYVLFALGIITPVAAFFIAYQFVEVKSPDAVIAEQNKTVPIYYSDGTTLFTQLSAADGGNRQMVAANDIPQDFKNALVAAEDKSFYSNNGFSMWSVARSVWFQVTGTGVGGGSGLTQQYVKKATGNDDPTYTRKFIELVQAYKMSQTYDKNDILAAYANIVYFGRGAYGIGAAAQAYYGKQVNELTKQECAQLAGMVQLPGRFKDMDYVKYRYEYTIGRMKDDGYATPEEAAAEWPKPKDWEDTKVGALNGPKRMIQERVIEELDDEKISLDDAYRKGYKITLSIDKDAQAAAEKAVHDQMDDEPKNLHTSLVAINPETGGIVAYYGGEEGTGLDWAQALQQPGSSFKPFDLVAALRKGIGLGVRYSSLGPYTAQGLKINNAQTHYDCDPECTIREAMRESINTTFSAMVLEDVGTSAVAQAAHDAGIPEEIKGKKTLVGENGGPPDINIAIGGGKTLVRTVDMAAAYATFAADGIKRAPTFVQKVEDPTTGGLALNRDTKPAEPAFDKTDSTKNADIARTVTESLVTGPDRWNIELDGGKRQAAAKTGTQQCDSSACAPRDNSKAWTVGYTKEVSTAVCVCADGTEAIKDKARQPISGGGLPGKVWQQFMNDYLKGKPKSTFPKVTKAIGQSKDTPLSTPPSSSSNPPSSSSGSSVPSVPPSDDHGRPGHDDDDSSVPPSGPSSSKSNERCTDWPRCEIEGSGGPTPPGRGGEQNNLTGVNGGGGGLPDGRIEGQ